MFNNKTTASGKASVIGLARKFTRSGVAVLALAATSAALAACSPGAQAGDSSTASGASASSKTSASADSLAKIKDAGVLRIGLEGTYKPYSFHDEGGALTGFEVEIAALVAKDLGVKAEYIETKWDSLIAGLDVDRYDIVINDVSPTPERGEKYDFSQPYIRTIGKIGVLEDSTLKTVDDIKGHSSAQTASSNYATDVEALGATIVPTNGFNDSIELVKTGRADATANSLVTFETFLKDNPGSGVRLLDGELPDGGASVILLPKGQDALREAVNASLSTRIDNGDLKNIYLKYVSEDLTPAK